MIAETEQLTDEAQALKEALVKQDKLKQKFDEASPADDYKDDIDIPEELKEKITIKMDSSNFYIKHLPSGIHMSCSAYTMPRALKKTIENWVESITKYLPNTSTN